MATLFCGCSVRDAVAVNENVEKVLTVMAEAQGNETVTARSPRDFHIRALQPEDRNWVADFLDKHWLSTKVVSRGQVHYGHLLPGFAAFPGLNAEEADPKAKALGLLIYRLEEDRPQLEIITINSEECNKGVGTALIETLRSVAVENGIKRLWVITTNDNLNALRFYQKRGFHLSALYPNAIIESRKLKPQIPIIGDDNIPLTDELELEMLL